MAQANLDIVIKVNDMASSELEAISQTFNQFPSESGKGISKSPSGLPTASKNLEKDPPISLPGFGDLIALLQWASDLDSAKGAAKRQTILTGVDYTEAFNSQWPINAPELTGAYLGSAQALYSGVADSEADLKGLMDAASFNSLMTGRDSTIIFNEIIEAIGTRDLETLQFLSPNFIPPSNLEGVSRDSQIDSILSEFISQSHEDIRATFGGSGPFSNFLQDEVPDIESVDDYNDVWKRIFNDPEAPISNRRQDHLEGIDDLQGGSQKVDPRPSEESIENFERYRIAAKQAAEASELASSASVGWQGVNQELASGLDGTVEILDEQGLSIGSMGAAWEEATQSSLGFGAATTGAERAIQQLAEGGATESVSEAVLNMHDSSAPLFEDLGGKVADLEGHLRSIPPHVSSTVDIDYNVSSNVSISDLLALGVPRGRFKIDDPNLGQRARGGPLTGVNLVGEEGQELIIGGYVFDAATTRKMLASGLFSPGKRLRAAGELEGDFVSPTSPEYPGNDALFTTTTTNRPRRSTSSTSSSASGGGGGGGGREETSPQETIKLLSSVLPQISTQAAEAAASVAPATFEPIVSQITRELEASLQSKVGGPIVEALEEMSEKFDEFQLNMRDTISQSRG